MHGAGLVGMSWIHRKSKGHRAVVSNGPPYLLLSCNLTVPFLGFLTFSYSEFPRVELFHCVDIWLYLTHCHSYCCKMLGIKIQMWSWLNFQWEVSHLLHKGSLLQKNIGRSERRKGRCAMHTVLGAGGGRGWLSMSGWSGDDDKRTFTYANLGGSTPDSSGGEEENVYRVTIQVVSNLPLTLRLCILSLILKIHKSSLLIWGA